MTRTGTTPVPAPQHTTPAGVADRPVREPDDPVHGRQIFCIRNHDGSGPGESVRWRHYRTTPIRHVFADQGFAGKLVDWAADTLKTTVEIVRKPADQRGFVVQPKRWVVERSLAWLTAHRRLARDSERDPEVSEALIRWAAINTMVRRLDRGRPAARQVPPDLHHARITTLSNAH
jgi:transposase